MKTDFLFRMIHFALLAALLGCSGIPILAPARPKLTAQPVPADALVVKNGMLYDGTGAPPLEDGIVVIQGERIIAVGRAEDFALVPGVRMLDARGGTILPGIINAHVHDTASALIRQLYFVQRGVTATCDVGSPLYTIPWYTDNSTFGVTARGFRSGPIINIPRGYPGTEELLYPVKSSEQAQVAVIDLVGRGVDMIKIALEPGNSKLPWDSPSGEPIPNLDLDELRTIVAQAHAYGKLVRVHLGTAELLDLALDAGVDTIEHIPLPRLADIDFKVPAGEYARLSPAYEAQLARIVRQKIVMVPTLDKITAWCESFAISRERKALCDKYALAPVHRFHALGGIIALGDDSGYQARTGMPVREMEYLLAAGLTPAEIIQAGTRVSAQVCGHGNELGTLEVGKLADIIVVGGNPLSNIRVMESVRLVIVNGQVAFSP